MDFASFLMKRLWQWIILWALWNQFVYFTLLLSVYVIHKLSLIIFKINLDLKIVQIFVF